MFDYFSHNCQLQPIQGAVVSLSSIEYAYGYGVYETIRVANGFVFFQSDHIDRLLRSASTIGLEHTFSVENIAVAITELVEANHVTSCNIKILLIGSASPAEATLYIQCLQPLFPDRKLYKHGVHTVTEQLERAYPQAKTLNMLPSYIAYRKARAAAAYDCLLINRHNAITEGTRTNFYVLHGNQIISPPITDILPGVTRDKVLQVARSSGFTISEQSIQADSLSSYDGAFLTSTSSKIMPIHSIDDHVWEVIAPPLKQLMQNYGEFLASYVAATPD